MLQYDFVIYIRIQTDSSKRLSMTKIIYLDN